LSKGKDIISFTNVGYDAKVELASGQVVRNGKLGVGDIGYPVVGVDIVDAQQIQAVNTQPDILEKS
jgi:hypothetical protein